MRYADLVRALEIFGFSDRVTLREIKARHRELVRRHHPDSAGRGGDPEQIRLVNAAYGIIREYAENYRFSFAEEEFYEQNPDERLRMQFADAPLWGSK
ncbi:J domain-containing protein [Geobacter hydrogenophilus]|uniref:Molecular chaperone DnaJ n=1 Tax=Geobacter hydrogenophilus TaxID=40983 RepID=A0A9W6FWY9_9BACT|nr:J domain-containing protein [Geobacter hydrogenophilus]MBT0895258.1 J domain-containing protein [Geobacter hydrogenophilus]GLI36560.1 molecular chaperone DnaJ [Geobacter hydrogenophilus]